MAKKKNKIPPTPHSQQEWLQLLEVAKDIIIDYCQWSSDHCDGRIIKEFIEVALMRINNFNSILIDALCQQYHCKDLTELAEKLKENIHFKEEE
jgi:hypothetical protein